MIILKDKTRLTYSIPEGKDHLHVYNSIIQSEEVDADNIEKLIYFPSTLYDLEELQYYYDDETKTQHLDALIIILFFHDKYNI